uniref:Uncharacterized protein n=1 Tax=Lepeophtheirus salmonis TaxID=72036 RepID=A0A0K2T1X8_LEPSM
MYIIIRLVKYTHTHVATLLPFIPPFTISARTTNVFLLILIIIMANFINFFFSSTFVLDRICIFNIYIILYLNYLLFYFFVHAPTFCERRMLYWH